jgi:hypothetical protein
MRWDMPPRSDAQKGGNVAVDSIGLSLFDLKEGHFYMHVLKERGYTYIHRHIPIKIDTCPNASILLSGGLHFILAVKLIFDWRVSGESPVCSHVCPEIVSN